MMEFYWLKPTPKLIRSPHMTPSPLLIINFVTFLSIIAILLHSCILETMAVEEMDLLPPDATSSLPKIPFEFEAETDPSGLSEDNWTLESHDNKSSHQYHSNEFDENDNKTLNEVDIDELMKLELSENPLRDPLSVAIPMTLIYSLILLSGLVGNISTCVVIARTSYMHTATNYYLFSLAMSDLLLLISGLPQEIYHIWIKYPYIFGEAFCVIRGLAAETSANATVLTITAFTVERFVAIVYPLKSHKLSQLSRVVRMIGIIWVVAFCLALPQAAQFGVKDHMSRHNENLVLIKGAWCTLVREIFPYAFQISICVFFAIPMTIISVLYVLIGLKLRRSRKSPLNPDPRAHPRHSQSHVVRMLVAVVVAFFICWAPFHAQRLMALYGTSQKVTSDFFMMFYQGLTHVSGIFYYLSTCVNPILYHIMSNKFRQAFKDTMGRLCGRPASRGHHNRTYSAMSYSHRSSRMIHYTSQRNNVNAINSQKKVVKLPENEKCPIDIGIDCRRNLDSNLNGNSNGNGRLSNPCLCSNNGNSINATKTATTMLSNNTFVTKTNNNVNCPVCGGSSNGIGGRRGVTFGFLGKARNKHVNHLYTNRNGMDDVSSIGNETSITPLNSSPSEKDGINIPMTRINSNSNGQSQRSNSISNQNSILLQLDLPKINSKSKPKPCLRAFLRRKIEKSKEPHSSLLSSSGFSNRLPSHRPPSDPSIPSTYAVTILDSKGKNTTFLQRTRTGSSGNIIIGGGCEGIQKNTHRATSNTSMDSTKSNNTNTISNSSLQDLDEGEYTSEELAGYMAEINLNLESPMKA